MRFFLILLAALMAIAIARPAQAQSGYDRPGADYTHFLVANGDPALCAARCERDARCRAWSFSYPRTNFALATCWLKSRVTPRKQADCCVAGVRGAGVVEPRSGPIEYSIDRRGGDYRHFELEADPAGAPCKAACEGDKRCRAWTYVRPGYGGSSARCYLKSRITRPRHRPCCISGVVR
jgi:PAN domain